MRRDCIHHILSITAANQKMGYYEARVLIEKEDFDIYQESIVSVFHRKNYTYYTEPVEPDMDEVETLRLVIQWTEGYLPITAEDIPIGLDCCDSREIIATMNTR